MPMTWEEYLEDTKDNAEAYIVDAIKYADEEGESVPDFSDLHAEMESSDSVTGAGSGSYTYDREKAKENIQDIIYDEDFRTCLSDFGADLPVEAEEIDVTARIVALNELYSDLEDYYNSLV